jgi:tRNA(fMet)-specific endonuclease VapC
LNKALLDTDILSEIGKAKDTTVAANAKTYRRSSGHFTFSTVSVPIKSRDDESSGLGP